MSGRFFAGRAPAGSSNDERFDMYWMPEPNSGCYLWLGSAQPENGGHGLFAERLPSGTFKTTRAHRFAFRRTNGPVPLGLGVLHRCNNALCVNPAHLYAGTQKENVRDCHAAGRNADTKGTRNGRAKLTEADVAEIRRVFTRRRGHRHELARQYGVSATMISYIADRKTWAHVE